MTLHDVMPAAFICLSFVFFVLYALSRMRLMLIGCGASCFAFAFSVLDLPVYIQAAAFFSYVLCVYGVIFVTRRAADRVEPNGIALTKTDRDGGYIMYMGEVRRARPRDTLYDYALGDVLYVVTLPDGSLCAYRL